MMSLYLFCPHLPSISTPFTKTNKQKTTHQVYNFCDHLLKIHTIYGNWAPFSVLKLLHHFTKFTKKKKSPQKEGPDTYTMSM